MANEPYEAAEQLEEIVEAAAVETKSDVEGLAADAELEADAGNKPDMGECMEAAVESGPEEELAADEANRDEAVLEPFFCAWLAAHDWTRDELTDGQVAFLRAAWRADCEAGLQAARAEGLPEATAESCIIDDPAGQARTLLADEQASATAAETRRQRDILVLEASHLQTPGASEIIGAAIAQGWAPEQCELELLRAESAAQPRPLTLGEW